MATLDKKEAFVHVIDSHRWLAASGCAWNLIKPGGEQEGAFDEALPNIQVMVRDCLLLHSRSLINFYTDHTNRKRNCKDILLRDYGISKPPNVEKDLGIYRYSIERHLLHLTSWRDASYRRTNAPKEETAVRLNWNKKASTIAKKLVGCLKWASKQNGPWQEPFKKLYEASAARYRVKSYEWPKELGEKLEQYLAGQNL